jgi:hypothetical protein
MSRADAQYPGRTVVVVHLKPGPFFIRVPRTSEGEGLQIGLSRQSEIFMLQPGRDSYDIPMFIPGTGIASTEAGDGVLLCHLPTDFSHNYLDFGGRLRSRVEGFFELYVSSIVESTPAGYQSRKCRAGDEFYAEMWIDENRDNVVDWGEYEDIILRFTDKL